MRRNEAASAPDGADLSARLWDLHCYVMGAGVRAAQTQTAAEAPRRGAVIRRLNSMAKKLRKMAFEVLDVGA